ncbi:MAG: hypothetical protein BWZ10_01900 [candidate division BRC1 bacterium ADurb.BinA364]|nr:MAG: hypothetical protein BWZ10_01900 [candidate division BRC1 bacterium ADurb.BinA364]
MNLGVVGGQLAQPLVGVQRLAQLPGVVGFAKQRMADMRQFVIAGDEMRIVVERLLEAAGGALQSGDRTGHLQQRDAVVVFACAVEIADAIIGAAPAHDKRHGQQRPGQRRFPGRSGPRRRRFDLLAPPRVQARGDQSEHGEEMRRADRPAGVGAGETGHQDGEIAAEQSRLKRAQPPVLVAADQNQAFPGQQGEKGHRQDEADDPGVAQVIQKHVMRKQRDRRNVVEKIIRPTVQRKKQLEAPRAAAENRIIAPDAQRAGPDDKAAFDAAAQSVVFEQLQAAFELRPAQRRDRGEDHRHARGPDPQMRNADRPLVDEGEIQGEEENRREDEDDIVVFRNRQINAQRPQQNRGQAAVAHPPGVGGDGQPDGDGDHHVEIGGEKVAVEDGRKHLAVGRSQRIDQAIHRRRAARRLAAIEHGVEQREKFEPVSQTEDDRSQADQHKDEQQILQVRAPPNGPHRAKIQAQGGDGETESQPGHPAMRGQQRRRRHRGQIQPQGPVQRSLGRGARSARQRIKITRQQKRPQNRQQSDLDVVEVVGQRRHGIGDDGQRAGEEGHAPARRVPPANALKRSLLTRSDSHGRVAPFRR